MSLETAIETYHWWCFLRGSPMSLREFLAIKFDHYPSGAEAQTVIQRFMTIDPEAKSGV